MFDLVRIQEYHKQSGRIRLHVPLSLLNRFLLYE